MAQGGRAGEAFCGEATGGCPRASSVGTGSKPARSGCRAGARSRARTQSRSPRRRSRHQDPTQSSQAWWQERFAPGPFLSMPEVSSRSSLMSFGASFKMVGAVDNPMSAPSAVGTRPRASSATRRITGGTAYRVLEGVRSSIQERSCRLPMTLGTALGLSRHSRREFLRVFVSEPAAALFRPLGRVSPTRSPDRTPEINSAPRLSPGPRGSFTVTPEGHALRLSVNISPRLLSTGLTPLAVSGRGRDRRSGDGRPAQ